MHQHSQLPRSKSICRCAIADLKSQIKGKAPREVASIIVQRFGPPNRDVGSGLTILDWDVVGGDLRLTVQGGPPIFRISDGKKLWLVETENPAGDNIVSEFEMSTLPDPKNHGSRSWLGDLTLRANRKYEYTRPEYDSVPNNFFSDNPARNLHRHLFDWCFKHHTS